MVENPHHILGVSEQATPDEIKKAYWQKTKEYHPDLHPNDPDAARKMGEINEAYDMLMNPEKYAAKKAQQQYGGAYQRSNEYHTGSGGQQSYNQSGPYGGFGSNNSQNPYRVKEYATDSVYIRGIIQDINRQLYQQAWQKLLRMPGNERTARWYYLAAVSNQGLGYTVQAYEQIQRAVQMEPNNMEYQQMLRRFQQQQRYQSYSQEHRTDSSGMQQMCMSLCAMNLCCNFCMPFRFFIHF